MNPTDDASAVPAARAVLAFARRNVVSLAIIGAAIAIATMFVAVTLAHTPRFGLPFDDAYIYLTYAKQFGRGEPFSYFPGGGYSAGSTSALWPIVLAPLWTLGARGHALVWVSFGLCTGLYAATCVGCQVIARRIAGSLAGALAGALALVIAPFAFTALAGMEVGLASALLIAAITMMMTSDRDRSPRRLLIACLAGASLSRPEAMMIVFGVCGLCAISRLRSGDRRGALWWLAPLVAPLVWLTANRLFAGHWFPNTGVAKSHFYLPGFDWTYWWDAVTRQSGRAVKRLFWDHNSPLVWPTIIAGLWLIGAARIVWWAHRQRRWLVAALVIGSPWALIAAVIASSGAWDFHNYRYIAAAFPLIMVAAACGLAPAGSRWVRRVWSGLAIAIVGLFVVAAATPLRADMDLYAQNAADLERQVVTLGNYIHDHLPESTIMFHDAGAIEYYGDRPGFDMLGLVTNFQADVANNGPGSRFEFLDSLAVDQRPTHFAYYPDWMGQSEFYGEVVVATPLPAPFHARRLVGGNDMQLIVANWDHAQTGERPLDMPVGWRIVDRLDVADVASERAHRWTGELGRRKYGDPTARWSFVHRQLTPTFVVDGGRTIRGRERLTLATDPAKPVRLVLRTGGATSYPWHDSITRPVSIKILGDDDSQLAAATIPPPSGQLIELSFEIATRGDSITFETSADGPYRSFHWFVIQPAH